MAQPIMLHKTW